MAPQLHRVVVVGDLADDRAEDGRAFAAVEDDGGDAEAAGAVAQFSVLDAHLSGGAVVLFLERFIAGFTMGAVKG